MIEIKTERLRIYPASREQMESIISAETAAELKQAYSEMLAGCIDDPDKWEWYAMWFIELGDGTHIGDLCFKGFADGSPEIGYGILDEYQGNGYATEAVRAAVKWALSSGANAVEAEAEEDNAPSLRVLEKCGFVPTGKRGEEGLRFIVSDMGADKK